MHKLDNNFLVFVVGFGAGMIVVRKIFTEKRTRHNLELEHIESMVKNNAAVQNSPHFKSIYTSPQTDKQDKLISNKSINTTQQIDKNYNNKTESPYSSLIGDSKFK